MYAVTVDGKMCRDGNSIIYVYNNKEEAFNIAFNLSRKNLNRTIGVYQISIKMTKVEIDND